MLRLLCLIGCSVLFSLTASAQVYWSAIHSVTGTTATAISLAQKSTGVGTQYGIRPTSLIVCSTQAGTFTLERGGTAPSSTLSTTYPTYVRFSSSGQFPTYNTWPFSVYTASDSTGGVVVSKIVLTSAGCVPFSGVSPDKKGFPLETQRSTSQVYTVRAALGSSGDVHFTFNGEIWR